MKFYLILLLLLSSTVAQAQTVKVAPPSYFGLQVRPVFPTNFIGSKEISLSHEGVNTKLTQKLGYSFGGTVRVGLTKLIALETGINFTQRNFDLDINVPDSNVAITDNLAFIEYDIPLNALFYVQLAEKWYMNASIGLALTFKPTHVGVYNTAPVGYHTFTHTGLIRGKVGADANANFGFEYRTEKKGFFYIGGSARVPFAPLFDLLAEYKWQGIISRTYGEVDGSFITLDFKYFFPNIKNKGPQFIDGPIE